MRCSQQIVRETNNLKLYAWQTLSFLWKVQQIQRFFFVFIWRECWACLLNSSITTRNRIIYLNLNMQTKRRFYFCAWEIKCWSLANKITTQQSNWTILRSMYALDNLGGSNLTKWARFESTIRLWNNNANLEKKN